MSFFSTYIGLKTDDRGFRLLVLTATVGATLSLTLLLVRAFSSISFSEAMQLQASGDEFSNSFVIWRVTQGLQVYADPMNPPYYHPVYNWLFYYFYGLITHAVLLVLSLSDAWLPTIGRYISLTGMLVSIAGCYWAFVKVSEADNRPIKILSIAFAVYVSAGPLVGFFNLSARADNWAMTLEIIGTMLFLCFNSRRRWMALFTLIVCGYLAWSFKQNYVSAVTACGLFLLIRKDFKRLAVLVTVLPGAWALTFMLAPPLYAKNILFSDFPITYTFAHMLRNLENAVLKSGPSLLPIAAIVLFIVMRQFPIKQAWQRDSFVFTLGGIFCSAALAIPASSQTGAAEHYFFVLSFFLALFVLACLPEIRRQSDLGYRTFIVSGMLGWGTLIVALSLVLFGNIGVTNLRPQHAYLTSSKKCLDQLPRPLFVNVPYLMLPWMNPSEEHYTISYTYVLERKLGKAFKYGGFGGLISQGKFQTVVLTRDTPEPPRAFDGASLSDYKLTQSYLPNANKCSDFYVYQRQQSNQ